jgi:hypothetical protein
MRSCASPCILQPPSPCRPSSVLVAGPRPKKGAKRLPLWPPPCRRGRTVTTRARATRRRRRSSAASAPSPRHASKRLPAGPSMGPAVPTTPLSCRGGSSPVSPASPAPAADGLWSGPRGRVLACAGCPWAASHPATRESWRGGAGRKPSSCLHSFIKWPCRVQEPARHAVRTPDSDCAWSDCPVL